MIVDLAEGTFVLDSWPVLEWLKAREPASGLFWAFLKQANARSVSLEMNRTNYGEVFYSVRKATDVADREGLLERFASLPLRVHTISDDLVDEAVELKARYPFSFADAFAAALAIRLQVPLVTGDAEFRALEADGLLRLYWMGR